MKFSSPVWLLVVPVLLVGCNSLDNPLRGMLNTGHDGRVFNARTGNYEWPEETNSQQQPAKSKKSAQVGAALANAATPTPAPGSDGRYYDSARREWVDPPAGGNPPPPKSKIATTAPTAATAAAPKPTPVLLPPAPTPAPRAQKSVGVYDPHTGKIEWQDSGGAMMATPKPVSQDTKKHWWWPF